MTKLLLVRHGQVSIDNRGRYWGHTDIPLSAEGRMQAGRLRDRLSKERIAAVYSSDLARALDTAAIIVSNHRVPVSRCLELREINFGEYEGLTFDEIKRRYPEAENSWRETRPGAGFPGGEGLSDLTRRVDRFLERLSIHVPQETVLVVAHGGPLRMLICRMVGLDPSRWWQVRIDPASLSILESYTEGTAICQLNDKCHLEYPLGGLQ